jgi:hypothetical protein
MNLTTNLRNASVVLAVLIMTACGGPTAPDVVKSAIKTYNPVWIKASWTGGKTGAPVFDSVGPGDFTGSYCPATSLILENHSTRYQSVFSWAPTTLVFKNTCNQSVELLVCRSGSPGESPSEFPICNPGSSSTPLSRLASVSLGPNNSGIQSTTWREAGLNLELNIFYCGVGDTFALGSIAGAQPTDCIQSPTAR